MEKSKDLRAEFGDEVDEKAFEQCTRGIAEKMLLRKTFKEVHVEVSEMPRLGEDRDTSADGGLETKSFELGDDTEMDPSRVFRSTFAGIRASEHRSEREVGLSPDVTSGGCHGFLETLAMV